MSKEYDTFVEKASDIPLGQECNIYLRDLSPGRHKYSTVHVRALVSSSAEQPKEDTLWLRFPLGDVHPQPLKIKVIKELDILAEAAE